MVKSIVDTLVERDGITREEAEEIRGELSDSFMDAISSGDFDLAEDIMMDVGLEPDYLEEFLC